MSLQLRKGSRQQNKTKQHIVHLKKKERDNRSSKDTDYRATVTSQ